MYSDDDEEKVVPNDNETQPLIKLEKGDVLSIIEKLKDLLKNEDELTCKRVLVAISAFFVAGFSVITNFEQGGQFAVDFSEIVVNASLVEEHKLTTNDVEIIKQFFAAMAAIVNGVINARTITFVGQSVVDDVDDIIVAEDNCEKSKSIVKLSSKIVFGAISALYVLQVVEDSVGQHSDKPWSPVLVSLLEGVMFIITAGFAFRGIDGCAKKLRNSSLLRCVPGIKKEQDEAYNIRRAVLKILNKEVNGLNLEEEKLEKLARGELYDGAPEVAKRFLKLAFFIIPPVFYAYAVSYGSAEEATTNLCNISASDQDDFAKTWYVYMIAALAAIFRGALLGNSGETVGETCMNNCGDDLLEDPIYGDSSRRARCGNWLKTAAMQLMLGLIAGSSLTGAMEGVEEYYFYNVKTVENLCAAGVLGLWGGGFINLEDVRKAKDIVFGVASKIYDTCRGGTKKEQVQPKEKNEIKTVARALGAMMAADVVKLHKNIETLPIKTVKSSKNNYGSGGKRTSFFSQVVVNDSSGTSSPTGSLDSSTSNLDSLAFSGSEFSTTNLMPVKLGYGGKTNS
jgi:hypothetical protein